MKWTTINIQSNTRIQFIDITLRISEIIRESGVKSGTCVIFSQHTTAGLTINENADPDVTRDILVSLSRLIPPTGDYRHTEGNSDAHLKASLMGFSLTVPIIDGRLSLGTWQDLYFCEFDGPRNRHVLAGISGD